MIMDKKLQVLIVLLSLSFWSSGVFLIRILHTYHVWDGGIPLVLLFVLSIPLVYLSIESTRAIFTRMGEEDTSPTSAIIALVVLIHALVLVMYPALYGFVPSPALAATAWLLWFGGSAMIIARILER